jgi:hypothetical protein
MTIREENEKLAIWAEIECRCKDPESYIWSSHPNWHDCPRHSNNGLPPDYDRDEVATTLLSKLTNYLIDRDIRGHQVGIYGDDNLVVQSEYLPTLAAAIKSAVLQLIEKEINHDSRTILTT